MIEAINSIKDWTQFNKQWYYYAIAVFICCSLDVLSGVFNAFMKETLNSKDFKKGAIGKTAIVSIVGLSMGLDYIFNTHYLYISTCIFYILEESVLGFELIKLFCELSSN